MASGKRIDHFLRRNLATHLIAPTHTIYRPWITHQGGPARTMKSGVEARKVSKKVLLTFKNECVAGRC